MTTSDEIQRARIGDMIRRAFADVAYPGDDNIAVPNNVDGDEAELALMGLHWSEVDCRTWRRYEFILSYFTPQAFHFYIPGIMLRFIDEPENRTLLDVMPDGLEDCLDPSFLRHLVQRHTLIIGLGCPVLSEGKGGGRIHDLQGIGKPPSPTLRYAKNGAPGIRMLSCDKALDFLRKSGLGSSALEYNEWLQEHFRERMSLFSKDQREAILAWLAYYQSWCVCPGEDEPSGIIPELLAKYWKALDSGVDEVVALRPSAENTGTDSDMPDEKGADER